MKPFLTAEWRKLILLTYAVDPIVLKPHLPEGLVLDTISGQAFVSFVAFDFLNTKVKGLSIPFHINFPEINLRFYVRHIAEDGSARRGVVFIKELVPKYCIALVANKVYNEPYEAIPMTSNTTSDQNQIKIEHHLTYKNREMTLKCFVDNNPKMPSADSTEHFFKEHEWGFGVNRKGQLTEYKVEHPHWEVYPLSKEIESTIRFEVLYGDKWKFLNQQKPYSIVVAEGSAIKVFSGHLV